MLHVPILETGTGPSAAPLLELEGGFMSGWNDSDDDASCDNTSNEPCWAIVVYMLELELGVNHFNANTKNVTLQHMELFNPTLSTQMQ